MSILLILLLFVSCSQSDGLGYTFKTDISDNPKNLDPQLATDIYSKNIIKNTFRGLLKLTETGAAVPDCAESFEMSPDSLVYTFTLFPDIYWMSQSGYEANLTAYDFEYAFKRIFDTSNASPYADELICIKNAAEIIQGIKSPDELAVKALSDTVLEITLEYPYWNFTELLTETYTMPCNETFFKSTKGRYGLHFETTCSNGYFYISDWNYDPYWNNNYLTLIKNPLNVTNSPVAPYSVKYNIRDVNESIALEAGESDLYIADNYNEKLFSRATYKQFQTKTYGISANEASVDEGIFKQIYNAVLACDLGELPTQLQRGYGIIPPAVTLTGKSFREMSGDNVFYNSALKNITELTDEEKQQNAEAAGDIRLTVSDDFPAVNKLYDLADYLLKNLGITIFIESVSKAEYDLIVAENRYDLLMTELSPAENSPESFFEVFALNGRSSAIAEGMVEAAFKASTLGEAVKLYSQAETAILQNAWFIPLCYGCEYLVYDRSLDGIIFIPFSDEIIFKDVKRF
ncbi:MAG: ABC transporter substrate-binding protein [Ruminococcus sp.]|nr:ABC transporter substrate-binding protein [Ruminococcus sp.]